MKHYLPKNISFYLLGFLLLISCRNSYNVKLAWFGEGAYLTGDISPDGVYFSDVNWNTGDLMLINIETDEKQDLTGEGYDSGYAWTSSFSNNGEHIAYEWYNYETGTHDLRLYSFENSNFKTLIPASEDILFLEPLDWFRSNKAILIAKKAKHQNWELGKFSIENGQYETIIKLDWNAPGGLHPYAYPHASLSPDDKYLVFDYRTENSASNNLYLVSVENGFKSVLLKSKEENRFLSWSKNGKEVLFYSYKSEIPSLWKLKVIDGKLIGNPKIVVEDVAGVTPIGYSDKGFVYSIRTGTLNTYITELNFQTGDILAKPKPVDTNCYCRNNVGDWSKNGESLMFIRFNDLPDAKESIVIKSLEDNSERVIHFPWDFHNKTGTVSWVSDSIVLIHGNSPKHSGIHAFNLNQKKISIPADYGKKGFFQRFESNSNGSKLYVEMRWQSPGVVEFDTKTGDSKTIFEGEVIPTSLTVSPNDDRLAYLQNDPLTKTTKLKVYDLTSKEVQTVIEQKWGILNSPVRWTAEGEKILVGVTLSNDKSGLWSIDTFKNSEPVFINLPEAIHNALVVSPNGQHVAFQSGTSPANYYFLEGF
ncbi:hypothetical protein U0L90_01230 [Flavobacteriaceae sp. LMIT009]